MASLFCNICLEEFSEQIHIPKMVECGHTFCSLCLKKILEAGKICPNCKKTLSKTLEEYPTNYIALQTIEKTDKSTCPNPDIVRTFKTIKEKLIIRKDKLVTSIENKNSMKDIVINDLDKIERIFHWIAAFQSTTDPLVLHLVEEFEENIERCDALLYCCIKPCIQPTYSLSTYIDDTFFLYDLANRIHKGEEIYAFEMVNKTPKFGRITMNESNIDVHALDLCEVGENAALVSFQDLRKCMTKDNFRPFICIGEDTLSFKVIEVSYLASRFIKLCSGENGVTVKNCTVRLCKKRYDACVVHYPSEAFTDYFQNKFSEETQFCDGHKNYGSLVVVQMFREGRFEIHNYWNRQVNLNNVVATGIGFCPNLQAITPSVVTDSGITFLIKLGQ